jgi:hypothetical protein
MVYDERPHKRVRLQSLKAYFAYELSKIGCKKRVTTMNLGNKKSRK